MSDEFTKHIFEIIVSKIAQAKGFSTISETALTILVDVVIDRLTEYARSAGHLTNFCGRIDTNGIDVFSSLTKYGETPLTLTNFLNTNESLTPFEFLIEPYPLPRLSKFYTTTNQSNQSNQPNQVGWNIVLPFRANTCIPVLDQKTPWIPPYLPSIPSRYTYDHTIKPDPPYQDLEAMKRHDDDQNQIQQALAIMLSGRNDEKEQPIHFDSTLTKLQSTDLMSKPTKMIESTIYSVEGDKPTIDPEFPPMIEVNEDTFIGDETSSSHRDILNMETILTIRHGTTETGQPKSSHLYQQDKDLKTPETPLSPK